MAATYAPARTFVVHTDGPGRPLLVRDLVTLRRVRVDSLDELPCTLRACLELRGFSSPRKVAELTEAEQRVASLATDGLANKEIAAALGVALRTVETHLTSAYRKLDVRSRAELLRLLQEVPRGS
jgi:DNA-binding NarL/FixJ family response regulator